MVYCHNQMLTVQKKQNTLKEPEEKINKNQENVTTFTLSVSAYICPLSSVTNYGRPKHSQRSASPSLSFTCSPHSGSSVYDLLWG